LKTLSGSTIPGGLIEPYKYMDYLYHLLFSIGLDGSILPNENIEYQFPDNSGRIICYNPTQLLLDAGYISIALYHMMSRHLYTENDMVMLRRLVHCSQITTHRLFGLKQLLLRKNNNTHVTKSHMESHFHLFIKMFGYPGITDSDWSENDHKLLKKGWDVSSKRIQYFQGKELLTISRLTHVAKKSLEYINIEEQTEQQLSDTNVDKEQYLDNSNNDEINIEAEKHGNNQNIFEFRMGSYNLFSNINSKRILDTTVCDWIISNEDDVNNLPIHPFIGLSQINFMMTKFLQDSTKNLYMSYKKVIRNAMIGSSYKSQWKLMLLKGARLIDEDTNLQYMVYCTREKIIESGNGISPIRTIIHKFNVVEVKYLEEDLNGDENTKYVPARIMSIIRIYDSTGLGNDHILFLVAYFKKVKILTTQMKQNPFDSIYKYHIQNGFLWLDLITPDQVSILN
jgi:hypothetical protein